MAPLNAPMLLGIEVTTAHRLLRAARDSLFAAIFALDDEGDECEALNDLYAACAALSAQWAGRGPEPLPEHIVRAAIKYRRRQGRSY